MRKQSTKSISFFMELLIVIFFFTISAGICVMIMSNARDKSVEADAIKQTLLYGQNLIEEHHPILQQSMFQMDDQGNIVENGMYLGRVMEEVSGTVGTRCTLHLYKGEKELSVLTFYRQEVPNDSQ